MTTIYRADPGTRQFAFDPETLSAPGATARLEDQLGYQGQLLQAMQEAGGDPLNSPQVQQAMAQHGAMSQALAQHTMAQAELAKANLPLDPKAVKNQILVARAQTGPLDPRLEFELGLPPSDPKAGGIAAGIRPTMMETVPYFKSLGKWPLQPGSFEHQEFMRSFGPEYQAAIQGKPYGGGIFGEAPWTTVARARMVRPDAVPSPPLPAPAIPATAGAAVPPIPLMQNTVTPMIRKRADERTAAVLNPTKVHRGPGR